MTTSPPRTPAEQPAPGGSGRQPPGAAQPAVEQRHCPICRRRACLDKQCARDMDTTLYAQQAGGH